MRRSTLCHLLLPVVLLACCGCEHDCYEIEMKPEGEAFHRRLTCWHVGGKGDKEVSRLSAEKLGTLAKLYPQRETPDDAKKQVFSGQFTGKTPNDVGGAGFCTCYTTPLGNTSAYVERFRGDDDLDGQLAKRRKAADQLADLLVGWMTAELGREPGFSQLKEFLDNDLRRDLRNLAAYTLTLQWQGSQAPFNEEFLVRAGQYFCERGYFSPQDIPTLVRALDGDDPKPLLRHIQRFLAQKMGISDSQSLPASLGFLDTAERLSVSCEKYVRSTELFRVWKEASKSRKEKNKERMASPEQTPVDEGEQLVAELALELIGFRVDVVGVDDSLRVQLCSREKPYVTNGAWDEKTGTVAWDGGVDTGTKSRPLPLVCFALWSTPNNAFQETHFGKVLLTGSGLAEYAIWYRGLKPDEAREWDHFLDGLKPGPRLAADLKAFRFSTDPKADPDKPEQPPSLADRPRQMILEALEGKPGETQ